MQEGVMTLDPELAMFETFSLPDFSNINALREWERQLSAAKNSQQGHADVLISDTSFTEPLDNAQIKVRIYRPAEPGPVPAMIYFHGGSFVMGNLETDHLFCLHYAHHAKIAVVSVDYRLAPEYPFPAGVEDCYAALLWLAEHAAQFSIDPARLVVAGSSAGGTLAAAVAIMARDRRGPKLSLQMLVYPALDEQMNSFSINCGAPQYGVTRSVIGQMWRYYLGGCGIATSAYAAPARVTDLSDLAPAYIEVGALDPLRDETINYASRLLQAGNAADLHVLAGAPHAFDVVESAAVTKQALCLRVGTLCKVLASDSQ